MGSEMCIRDRPDRFGDWVEYIDTDVDSVKTNESKHHLYFCNVIVGWS